MAGTVALLLKSTPTQNAIKLAKSARSDEPGDVFKAELGRAKNRQSNDNDDRAAETKKNDKTSSAKKPHAKGKPKKSDDQEQDPTVAGDSKSNDKACAPTDPAAVADDAATDSATDTVTISDASADPATTKDKPAEADPNAAALAIAVPVQKPATDTKTAETDTEQAAATVAAVATPTQPTATDSPNDPAAEQTPADPKTAGNSSAKDQSIDAAVAALGDDSAVAIQPKASRAKALAADPNADTASADAALAQIAIELPEADSTKPHSEKPVDAGPSLAVSPDLQNKLQTPANAQAAKVDQPQLPPEARFAEANHAEIVKGIQTELMPRGGTMQIRLDPPELGALQVILTVKDGVMNATFQTSSDDSSRMLSHSLGQLKTALESAGVTVDKLQVRHAPRDTQTNTGAEDQRHQPGQDDMSRQQEQQRKEMIKRMWRKLAGENDPLDMVA